MRLVRINILLAVTYFITGQLCLQFLTNTGYASPIWIPAGIALAGVILWGKKALPGIFLGSLLISPELIGLFEQPNSIWIQIAHRIPITIVSAIQAWLGCTLIHRYINWPNPLLKTKEILKFLLLGGPVACLFAATVSTATLFIRDIIGSDQIFFEWLTWYVGDSVGVFLVTPIVLSLAASKGTTWGSRRWLMVFPLLISIFIVAYCFYQAIQFEHAQQRAKFVERANFFVEHIEDDLQLLDQIPSIIKLHDSNPSSPEQFRHTAQTFYAILPSLFAVSWDDLVLEKDREAYERRKRIELKDPNFRIWEMDSEGKPKPAAKRNQHIVVSMTESSKVGLIGFDATSYLPHNEPSLESAHDLAPKAISGIPLLGDPDGKAGILLYYPIQGKSGQVQGYYSVLAQIDEFLATDLSQIPSIQDEIAVVLFSQEGHNIKLFQHGIPASARLNTSELYFEKVIGLKTVSSANWKLQIYPTKRYLQKSRRSQSWLILTCGLVFSGLFSVFLLSLTGTRESMNRITTILKDELSQKERAHENVRQLEMDISRIWRLNTIGIMASGLAHELNQPLTAIRNYSEGLLRIISNKQLNSEAIILDSLKEISQEAERAGKYIQNLRAFITKREPNKTLEDFNSIVSEIIELTAFGVRNNNVELTTDLKAVGAKVFVDRIQIGKVILNLIRNAIDSMAQNEPSDRKLKVETSIVDNKYVRVSVIDNGCGIADDDRPKVFEPFYRAKNSRGMGLGLAIGKAIVDSHLGQMWNEPNEMHGSTFHLQLVLSRKE